MNLAYQELYLTTAAIFRKYSLHQDTSADNPATGAGRPTLALYDTIRERDVDAVADLLVPGPAVGSKGIKVKIM